MNFFLRSAVASATFLLMAVLIVTLVFLFGPTIEKKVSPVVTNAEIVVIPSAPGSDELRVLLTSVKQREVCELVDRIVSVRVGPDTWVRGTAFFKDSATGNLVALGKTRPVGDRIIDELHIKPKGIGLHIILNHRCHPFWMTTTTQTYINTL